jgi:hypothetical protein
MKGNVYQSRQYLMVVMVMLDYTGWNGLKTVSATNSTMGYGFYQNMKSQGVS